MCDFFSLISRKGVVKFFTPEDVVQIMASGNPENYTFNSHTSLMHYLGIKGDKEDCWTKWEFNPETKTLKLDEGKDEYSDDIKSKMEKFFENKDILYLRNLYGRNSGNRNSGDWNSGNWNSGHWNSGHWNSGNRNSGNWNSGDWNSGDRNSGNRNSGDWNSGNGVLNSFCTQQHWMLFDKPCTKKQYSKINALDWSWFDINQWVNETEMTDDEKASHPTYKSCGGYLKTTDYKEAFKVCPKEFIEKVKKLENFDAKKFEEISGLKV